MYSAFSTTIALLFRRQPSPPHNGDTLFLPFFDSAAGLLARCHARQRTHAERLSTPRERIFAFINANYFVVVRRKSMNTKSNVHSITISIPIFSEFFRDRIFFFAFRVNALRRELNERKTILKTMSTGRNTFFEFSRIFWRNTLYSVFYLYIN